MHTLLLTNVHQHFVHPQEFKQRRIGLLPPQRKHQVVQQAVVKRLGGRGLVHLVHAEAAGICGRVASRGHHRVLQHQ